MTDQTQNIGPQRAAPKSIAALHAEMKQKGVPMDWREADQTIAQLQRHVSQLSEALRLFVTPDASCGCAWGVVVKCKYCVGRAALREAEKE